VDYGKKAYSVEYINVLASPENMDKMLAVTDGARDVPVIVEEKKTTVGFGGS